MSHYPSGEELAAFRVDIAEHRDTPIDDVDRAGWLTNPAPLSSTTGRRSVARQPFGAARPGPGTQVPQDETKHGIGLQDQDMTDAMRSWPGALAGGRMLRAEMVAEPIATMTYSECTATFPTPDGSEPPHPCSRRGGHRGHHRSIAAGLEWAA